MRETLYSRPGSLHKKSMRVFLIILSGIIFSCSVAVFAWLYIAKRKVAGVGEIADPTAIYINSGNMENYRYINLSGIDLDEGTSKDFVFCVRGTDINYYRLQLAYTTNNQFDYEIYPATLLAGGNVPANDGYVEYLTHPSSGSRTKQTYYIPSGTSAIPGTFKNKESEILAYQYDSSHTTEHIKTYESYNNVNQYAEPLYWQCNSSIAVRNYIPETDDFCDYYILRVSWAAAKAAGRVTTNKRETDILYIAAKAFTD